MTDLETVTVETFEPLQGERFNMQVAEGVNVSLELAEVTRYDARRAAPGAPRMPFSLIFLAPDASHHPQRMYTLEHASLEALSVFLVPLGPLDGRMRYQAVFN